MPWWRHIKRIAVDSRTQPWPANWLFAIVEHREAGMFHAADAAETASLHDREKPFSFKY